MTLHLYWDTTEIALPEENGIKIELRPLIGKTETSDGTLRLDTIGPSSLTKARVTLKFAGLTASEYSTLSTAWDSYASAVKTLAFKEDTTTLWSYDVLALHNGWKEGQWYDINDDSYIDVTLVFDEA